MIEEITQAFENARSEFSVDRVLADPDLNLRFVEGCVARGLQNDPVLLNRKLINLRKSGKLGKLKAKQTRFNDDEYRFAAEIAARHLERRDRVTVDDILVDPDIAREFDSICEDICPGFSPLRYRWSALRLRKSRQLSPEIIGHALPSAEVILFPVASLDMNDIPRLPGIYCFVSKRETLYVGEAQCLRARLKKHLDHSDNKNLARWIWSHGADELTLEVHVLERNIRTKIRRALETEMIRSRKPAFNVLGKME